MDTNTTCTFLGKPLGIAAATLIGLSGVASAATISFNTTGPTLAAGDISNLTGAARDGLNVNDGNLFDDGAANDAFTYVAGDRDSQGQAFTTGNDPFSLASIWVQHVGYTNNGSQPEGGYNGTWWGLTGGELTVRLTDPAQAGGAGFVLQSENYTFTGSEENNPAGSGTQNSDNGSGVWLQINLDTPVALAANTQYGFDVASAGTHFFELLGTGDDAYAGGSAYNGDGTALVGDRVFAVSTIPEPSTWALGLGGVALLIAGLRRRIRR